MPVRSRPGDVRAFTGVLVPNGSVKTMCGYAAQLPPSKSLLSACKSMCGATRRKVPFRQATNPSQEEKGATYRGTSLMRKRPTLQDPPRTLGIGLL